MRKSLLIAAVAVGLGWSNLVAQAPGVQIIEQSSQGVQAAEKAIREKAEVLRQAGKLLDAPAMKRQIAAPTPELVALPKPNRRHLAASEVAARARDAHVKLGWYYLCKNCDRWHVNLAAGYAITADGVAATCEHVVQPPQDSREGYFIAVSEAGEVLPVTSILTKSGRADTALVRVAGWKAAPLPLNDQVRPGDTAYCYSCPLGQAGYFSDGIVNRFYWKTANRNVPDHELDAVRHLRLNVSTDWAPGSSGAAVLDDCGNAIGHVSVISTLGPEPKATTSGRTNIVIRSGLQGPLMVLHEAVSARTVRMLAQAMNLSVVTNQAAAKAAAKGKS